jgi:hypothetical protein
MVVQLEANGLEARFWIVSGLPTIRPVTSRFSGSECYRDFAPLGMSGYFAVTA